MRSAVQKTLDPSTSESAGLAERQAAASYIASLSADLAEIARRHGLDSLGYVLDMARLEAEHLSVPVPRPGAGRN